MGARTIPRGMFLSILRESVNERPGHEQWDIQWRWPGPEESAGEQWRGQ